MVTKAQRHHHILRLLHAEHPANQTELVRQLARAGIEATQATLSRDLRELGVVKSAAGYQVLSEARPLPPGGRPAAFTAAVRRLLVKVSHGGTQVVLRTPPGQANALAVEIDHAADDGVLSGVLGTIAGDDCIFVACSSTATCRAAAKRLSSIARQSAATSNRQLAQSAG